MFDSEISDKIPKEYCWTCGYEFNPGDVKWPESVPEWRTTGQLVRYKCKLCYEYGYPVRLYSMKDIWDLI